MRPEHRLPIDGDELLWRRLTTPEWIAPNSDGTKRVSSAAFKGHENDLELSTHIASLTTLDWVFNSQPEPLAIAEIFARDPQGLGLAVEHKPDDDDYSHAVIHLNPIYAIRKKTTPRKWRTKQLCVKDLLLRIDSWLGRADRTLDI